MHLSRGERLFSEPPAGKIELAESSLVNDSGDVLAINIPLEVEQPHLSGPKASHALAFKLDHSSGAAQGSK